jgi:purine-binding chemotaxis protein CheW
MMPFGGQLAIFRLAEQRYAVPVLVVEEFFRPVPITPVPGSDPRVAGLINLRGVSATVVDLRTALGLPPRNLGETSRMLMLETAETLPPEARAAGLLAPSEPVVLLVDRVDRIATVAEHACHPPPAHTTHGFAAGVYELDGGYVMLLAAQAILDDILAQHPAPGSATP